MPIELGFILTRLAEMAAQDESLRTRQPWQAAFEKDFGWLGETITKHYHGDDGQLTMPLAARSSRPSRPERRGLLARRRYVLRAGKHPTLGRTFHECGYAPMIELLRYLEANGFTNYIASGGDRDFMQPSPRTSTASPAKTGSIGRFSNALAYVDDEHGGTVSYEAEGDFFDDGPVKPVRIWSRIGKRPILAAGNSNGDIPMLRYAGGKDRPAIRLLVLHDDEDREFAYTAGAETSLELAAEQNWTGDQRQERLGQGVWQPQLEKILVVGQASLKSVIEM